AAGAIGLGLAVARGLWGPIPSRRRGPVGRGRRSAAELDPAGAEPTGPGAAAVPGGPRVRFLAPPLAWQVGGDDLDVRNRMSLRVGRRPGGVGAPAGGPGRAAGGLCLV